MNAFVAFLSVFFFGIAISSSETKDADHMKISTLKKSCWMICTFLRQSLHNVYKSEKDATKEPDRTPTSPLPAFNVQAESISPE
jgi:hypothetical protein